MSLHKTIANNRIENSFNDGYVEIGELTNKTDEFNTIIAGEYDFKQLGIYAFRLRPIHSTDKREFGNKGRWLRYTIRISENHYIRADMYARINGELLDIVKTYSDIKNQELELVLAEVGGSFEFKETDQ